jgi:hypothetical protein
VRQSYIENVQRNSLYAEIRGLEAQTQFARAEARAGREQRRKERREQRAVQGADRGDKQTRRGQKAESEEYIIKVRAEGREQGVENRRSVVADQIVEQ